MALKQAAMGGVISFEQHAVARLRERLGAAEEARADLLAFARGHSGAVASIHAAVLAAMEADGIDELVGVVTRDWPQILGLDTIALALIVGEEGFRADARGIEFLAPRIIARALDSVPVVEMRNVARGHPLFGPACGAIRSEALVRIPAEPPLPCGLLALGQHDGDAIEGGHGAELLQFLGASLAAIIRRWLIAQPTNPS